MLTKKPKSSATHNDVEERRRSGLHSLFMMLVGAFIAVMFGVFLYLSPLFGSKKKHTAEQVQAPAVIELKPSLPEKQGEYEFYDVLPNQQFESRAEAITNSSWEEVPKVESRVDVVVRDERVNEEMVDDVADDELVQDEIVQKLPKPKRSETTDVATEHSNKKPVMNVERSRPDVSYILQIRSYIDSDEADRSRSEVIMAGVDARVVVRPTDNDIFYQVISVEYATKDEVMQAQRKLTNNGIDSLIVELSSKSNKP